MDQLQSFGLLKWIPISRKIALITGLTGITLSVLTFAGVIACPILVCLGLVVLSLFCSIGLPIVLGRIVIKEMVGAFQNKLEDMGVDDEEGGQKGIQSFVDELMRTLEQKPIEQYDSKITDIGDIGSIKSIEEGANE
jgi:hypothetical protein